MQMVPESSQRGSVPPALTPTCPQTLFWGSNKNSEPLLAEADGESRWPQPALQALLPCSLSWEPPRCPICDQSRWSQKGASVCELSEDARFQAVAPASPGQLMNVTEDAERPSKESNWLGRSPKLPNNYLKRILPALPENSSPGPLTQFQYWADCF